MIAFVLGGGGNRGALQVGALQVLLENGIVPDIVTGVSVGAINGVHIACKPTQEAVDELAHLWSVVRREDLYPGNYLTALWSLLRGKESLFTNENWRRFLQQHLPCPSFGDIQTTACYVAATEFASGNIRVFGDDPEDSILDALMASCALPPLHPPYRINGMAYIDGGAAANLPLRIAIDRGATEIYALNVSAGLPPRKRYNVVDVSARAVDTIIERQIALDLEHCFARDGVWVRRIELVYNGDLKPWDFSRTPELIALGKEAARAALAQGPLRPPTWQERLAETREKVLSGLFESSAVFGKPFLPQEPVKSEVVVRR
jgi:NTE family protein